VNIDGIAEDNGNARARARACSFNCVLWRTCWRCHDLERFWCV